MLTSTKYVQKKSNKLTNKEQSIEWYLCRKNPFYYIFNYVSIPEIGGILKYEETIMHSKIKQTIRSIYKYRKSILMASRQLGKALDVNTSIITVFKGRKRMGDLKVNDWIFDGHGNPTKIIATTDVMYNRPCYKITFNNNESIIADENHLWKISTSEINKELKTSKEIYELYSVLKDHMLYLSDDIYITSINKTESVPVRCIQVSNKDGMFLCGKTKIPTHNSTIAAALLEWSCNFFPRLPATILNANKTFALENLEKVKFIHNNTPNFLRTPLKFRGERKTTIDYTNNSILRVFYPSSTTSPSKLARSLTSPILYIDEAAHIAHMRQAYGAAQPTLSRAREQAKKNNYPYFILVTSTP